MPTPTQERKINGKQVKVTKFPMRRGWKLIRRLSKTVMPAIGIVAGSMRNFDDPEIDGDGLYKAILHLVTELNNDDTDTLTDDLLELTWVEGKEVAKHFDTVFDGDYNLFIKTLMFVIDVNWSNFLGESGIERLKEAFKLKVMTEEE